MSNASERAGERADRARRQFSNSSLATGRRGRADNNITVEQNTYRNRYRETRNKPLAKTKPTITDTNNNYPDTEWNQR